MKQNPKPQPARAGRSARIAPAAFMVLVALLALPTCALSRLAGAVDWRILAGVPTVVSTFAFFAYRGDKRAAESGEWRVPESTLHLLELLGGWPGGFLAQRRYRHKTAKLSFQVVFWLIVLIHQFAAFDSLNGWSTSRAAVSSTEDMLGVHARWSKPADRGGKAKPGPPTPRGGSRP